MIYNIHKITILLRNKTNILISDWLNEFCLFSYFRQFRLLSQIFANFAKIWAKWNLTKLIWIFENNLGWQP